MRFLTFASVFLLVITTACSAPTPNINSPTSSTNALTRGGQATEAPTPVKTKTIDDEAQNYANAFWGKRTARCNGNFFWVALEKGRLQKDQQFFQCKAEPSVTVYGQEILARELSEADKLNGVDPRPIEWDGKGAFSYRTCRLSWGGLQNWEPWQDADELRFRIRRVKGSWTIDEITPNDINIHTVYEINCKFVEEYLKNHGLSP